MARLDARDTETQPQKILKDAHAMAYSALQHIKYPHALVYMQQMVALVVNMVAHTEGKAPAPLVIVPGQGTPPIHARNLQTAGTSAAGQRGTPQATTYHELQGTVSHTTSGATRVTPRSSLAAYGSQTPTYGRPDAQKVDDSIVLQSPNGIINDILRDYYANPSTTRVNLPQ